MQTNTDVAIRFWHYRLGSVWVLELVVSFILQWVSERPFANISKWSHFKLWPVDDVVCDSRCMTGTCDPLKMFSFSVVQSAFCFSNGKILAAPTTSLINNLTFGNGWSYLCWEKRTWCDEQLFPNVKSCCLSPTSTSRSDGCSSPLASEDTSGIQAISFPQPRSPWQAVWKRELWEQPIWNNKGNHRILPIRFHAVCIYGACLK